MTPGHQTHRFLHSFDINPQVHFELQHPNEKIVLILRAHPITQIPWILNAIILFVFLFFINFFLPSLFSAAQIIFLNIFSLAFIFSYLWFNFLTWFFNVGIVTNERVVDIDFHFIIYKEVTATHLSKVEDVTAKSAGFFSSIFNFGNLFVQTAGTEVNIEFLNIPEPSSAAKIINQLVSEEHG